MRRKFGSKGQLAEEWQVAGENPFGFGDPRVPPLAAGIFGLPVGFLVIVGLSLVDQVRMLSSSIEQPLIETSSESEPKGDMVMT